MKRSKMNIMHIILLLIPVWGIMLLQLVVRVRAFGRNYVTYTLIFTVLMIALILLSYMLGRGFPTKKQLSFNPVLMTCWLALCFLMLYSDIVVTKKYCYASLVLLVFFTTLFVVWQQHDTDNREQLFDILLTAIETGFIFASVICIFFRPYTPGIRYLGLSANPNVYGIFLISVWACLITRLDYCIGNSSGLKRIVILGSEFGTAAMFLYLTAARTAFLTIGLISTIWFIFRIIYTRRQGKPLLKYAVSIVTSMLVTFAASYLLLSIVPKLVNHPLVFRRDKEFTAELDAYDQEICYAEEIGPDNTTAGPDNTTSGSDNMADGVSSGYADMQSESAGIQSEPSTGSALNELEKEVVEAINQADKEPSPISRLFAIFGRKFTLDDMFNGRISIFKKYIDKLDFKGHYKTGRNVNGTYVVNAHNNIIQIAYSYGIGAAIAYVLLCLFVLLYSFHYYIVFHDKRKNAAFPMLITVAFIISSLMEYIFLPMQSLLAFSFFMCIGELMIAYSPSGGRHPGNKRTNRRSGNKRSGR